MMLHELDNTIKGSFMIVEDGDLIYCKILNQTLFIMFAFFVFFETSLIACINEFCSPYVCWFSNSWVGERRKD